MDQDFYIEENNTVKIIITIFIFAALIVGGILYYMNHRNETTVKLKNVTVELGDKLPTDINYYITTSNPERYVLDISNISVDEAGNVNSTGEYSYRIKYNGDIKKGKLFVKDTTKPLVQIEELTVGVNEDFSPSDYLISCEDLSLPCTVKFKDSKDLNLNSKEGIYNTTIIISDNEGNEVIKNTKLIVQGENTLANKKASDLSFDHLSEDDNSWNQTYTVKFDNGVSEESVTFNEKLEEISTKEYIFNKKVADKKILVVYNKYNYAIGLSIKVTFTDNSVSYITKDNATENLDDQETNREN